MNIFEDCTDGAMNITIQNGCLKGISYDQTGTIIGFGAFIMFFLILGILYVLTQKPETKEKVKQ